MVLMVQSRRLLLELFVAAVEPVSAERLPIAVSAYMS